MFVVDVWLRGVFPAQQAHALRAQPSLMFPNFKCLFLI